MTTHEYDAYCDTLAIEPQDDSLLLAEMERDHIEMQEAHEAALIRRGSIEALKDFSYYMSRTIVAAHNIGKECLIDGLVIAQKEIRERIATLEVPVEAGGEFPTGYFGEGKVAA